MIVIETEKVKPGELRINYTGTLSVESPDLSSYNLANAAEKLNLERATGCLQQAAAYCQLTDDSLYYANLKKFKMG